MMELDDLKSAWAQYDKKLSENLKFNEELFKKLNLDKSRREMSFPLNYEYGSVIISIVFLLLLTSWTIQFGKDRIYLISGILSILSFIIMLGFALIKIKLLSNIDYYNSPVIDLQKALYQFKVKYLRLKRFEIMLFPFFVIFLMPICAKGFRNFDLMSNPISFVFAVILAMGIGLPFALWIYKQMYEKKIKNTSNFLSELTKFEEEK